MGAPIDPNAAEEAAILGQIGMPKRVEADGTVTELPPIPEQIAAHRYLATIQAMTQRRRGLRFSRLVLPKQVPVPGGPYPLGPISYF